MSEEKGKGFRFRAFTSFVVLFSFAAVAASGAALYFTPRGRVANWTDWTLLGLTKDQWTAFHVLGTILFLVFGVIHIVYNWRAILSYLRKLPSRALRPTVEMCAALLLTVVVVAGAAMELQPFRAVMDLNESIKDYWEKQTKEKPPVPHAETLTVEEFCSQAGISVDAFLSVLKGKGYSVPSTSATIREIADANGISPSDLYRLLQGRSGGGKAEPPALTPRPEPRGNGNGQGRGFGRMTLGDLCDELGMDVRRAIAILAARGVTSYKDMRVRDIADKLGVPPYQVEEILKNSK